MIIVDHFRKGGRASCVTLGKCSAAGALIENEAVSKPLVNRDEIGERKKIKRKPSIEMKTMNVVNAVQLFILVWTFTAVCRADDDISVSCKNVTGTVGEEVTFSCSVSLKKSDCCIRLYKFYYIKNNTDSTICKEEFHDSCEQRDISTCRFSSTTVMTGQFRFFVQTTCGWNVTKFTVNITESSKPEPVTEDRGKKETNNRGVRGSKTGDYHGLEEDPPSNNFIINAAVGCFIITILIIILMAIIYKTKLNYRKPYGLQKKMLLGEKHDDDISNCPENEI